MSIINTYHTACPSIAALIYHCDIDRSERESENNSVIKFNELQLPLLSPICTIMRSIVKRFICEC